MEEKRRDLINTQQKEVLDEIVAALNQSHPSFYYLSTVEIAAEIKKYIHQAGNLNHEKYQLLRDLKRADIQILLSFHNDK